MSARNRTPVPAAEPAEDSLPLVVRRHLRFGWGVLLVFLSLGLVLEVLHGFKVASYVNPSGATRRLMWTLAHSHGTLLGVLNLAFALTLPHLRGPGPRPVALASRLLLGATILLPGGFFLGGLGFHEGDPGLGVILVPPGALALIGAVAQVLRLTRRQGTS